MIELPDKITLSDVFSYISTLGYTPQIYTELNSIGLNPQLLYIKPNVLLTEEQKQQFMLLIIKYS